MTLSSSGRQGLERRAPAPRLGAQAVELTAKPIKLWAQKSKTRQNSTEFAKTRALLSTANNVQKKYLQVYSAQPCLKNSWNCGAASWVSREWCHFWRCFPQFHTRVWVLLAPGLPNNGSRANSYPLGDLVTYVQKNTPLGSQCSTDQTNRTKSIWKIGTPWKPVLWPHLLQS